MREEAVSIASRAWLIENGWEIKAFDFPGSGTGKMLHRKGDCSKNSGIIPDIIATKNESVAIFENKPKFFESDISKLVLLKNQISDYTECICVLIGSVPKRYLYGICIGGELSPPMMKKCEPIDIVLLVDSEGGVMPRKGAKHFELQGN